MGRSTTQHHSNQSGQQQSTITLNQQLEDSLPVFVFPNSLNFYVNEPSSHKQILTLYNPYDFTIKFKVLSTAPQKYNVIEPEGYIRPRSCLDITVRLLDASLNNVLREDQFRVQMRREDKAGIHGKRDISAVLLAAREDHLGEKENTFEQISSSNPFSQSSSFSLASNYKISDNFDKIGNRRSELSRSDRQPAVPSSNKPHPFYIFTAVVCGLVLCLPSDERETRFPAYLNVSATPKIIAAYILGLITSIICKYN